MACASDALGALRIRLAPPATTLVLHDVQVAPRNVVDLADKRVGRRIPRRRRWDWAIPSMVTGRPAFEARSVEGRGTRHTLPGEVSRSVARPTPGVGAGWGRLFLGIRSGSGHGLLEGDDEVFSHFDENGVHRAHVRVPDADRGAKHLGRGAGSHGVGAAAYWEV